MVRRRSECSRSWPLASLVSRYGKQQHADFQPSNIFYDEETNTFVFIDIGGIGAMVGESDQVCAFPQLLAVPELAY